MTSPLGILKRGPLGSTRAAARPSGPGDVSESSSARPQPNAIGGLSTAEREKLRKDPAVSAVTDLFGGDVVNVQKDSGPAPEGETNKEG